MMKHNFAYLAKLHMTLQIEWSFTGYLCGFNR